MSNLLKKKKNLFFFVFLVTCIKCVLTEQDIIDVLPMGEPDFPFGYRACAESPEIKKTQISRRLNTQT